MEIRKAVTDDLGRIMEIYEHARSVMAMTGNPNQWGPTNWPPRSLIVNDIKEGKSYVCISEKGDILAVFYYDFGKDTEPCYRVIEEGQWKNDNPYGVVHRIASSGEEKGAGSFCIGWAFCRSSHLRIDTHPDNHIMQKTLKKLGFEYCGIIHVTEDPYPRFAYEKTKQ